QHHTTHEGNRRPEGAGCFCCKHCAHCQHGVCPHTLSIVPVRLCAWLLPNRHVDGFDLAVLPGYDSVCSRQCGGVNVPDIGCHDRLQGVQRGNHESREH